MGCVTPDGFIVPHRFARHPWPTPADSARDADPAERLARSLRELYRYFDANQQMLGDSYRDIEVMPAFVGELLRAQVGAMHASLMVAWPAGANRDRLASKFSDKW